MEEASHGLPVLRSSDHAIPAEHAFAVYHDTNAPLMDTDVLAGGSEFWMNTVDYLVDDVIVGRLDTGPHSMRRTDHHLRGGSTDWIMVQLRHTGALRGTAGRDTTVDLAPQTLGVLDLSEPMAAWSSGGVSTCIALPRHRVADADQLGAVTAIDRSSPRGKILSAAISDLWRRLGRASAADAPDLADGIAESLRTVLSNDDFTPTDQDLALAMRDFLKVNLNDLDLGVDALRSAFHCSRATVYRLFTAQGGVREYIREQRLLRCFDELARPAKLPRLVSDVAVRWGFDNPSHFNRVFKARFGLPPSGLNASVREVWARSVEDAATTARMQRFHSWATAAS